MYVRRNNKTFLVLQFSAPKFEEGFVEDCEEHAEQDTDYSKYEVDFKEAVGIGQR